MQYLFVRSGINGPRLRRFRPGGSSRWWGSTSSSHYSKRRYSSCLAPSASHPERAACPVHQDERGNDRDEERSMDMIVQQERKMGKAKRGIQSGGKMIGNTLSKAPPQR